jgi:hypothetical protein
VRGPQELPGARPRACGPGEAAAPKVTQGAPKVAQGGRAGACCARLRDQERAPVLGLLHQVDGRTDEVAPPRASAPRSASGRASRCSRPCSAMGPLSAAVFGSRCPPGLQRKPVKPSRSGLMPEGRVHAGVAQSPGTPRGAPGCCPPTGTASRLTSRLLSLVAGHSGAPTPRAARASLDVQRCPDAQAGTPEIVSSYCSLYCLFVLLVGAILESW